jgi:hypothetical protein
MLISVITDFKIITNSYNIKNFVLTKIKLLIKNN